MKFIPINSDSKGDRLVEASDFSGGKVWLNSEPLEIEDLRGKVVLVDFWTYSCINCRRTLPFIRSWWEKYKDKDLVIVGVHTPEFEFEKDTENVRAAIEKYGVAWPVVQDNDYKIWRAYKNNFWPHKYLINKEGKIVYDHIGEGAYEETERRIQDLLGVTDMQVTQEPQLGSTGFGVSQTPELYVNRRGQSSGHIGKGNDKVELIGNWRVGKDYSSAGEDAKLKLQFRAAEVNLVMSVAEDKEKRVKVRVDGGNQDEIIIGPDDLYLLWKGDFGRHTLEMEFERDTRIHAFTFGR
jgi:thiol-disulfide isomerase/thioredoxin